MVGRECYSEINRDISEALEEKKVLVAVHRGTWGGNIVENTIAAYEACLAMGAEMFEVDLSNSTDGVLYACHDGGETRLFGREENIKTMSSREIDSLTVRNCIGEPSMHRLERFEEILEHFSHRGFYNVDRAWWFLPQLHEVMSRYPEAVTRAVIKTPVKEEYLEFFRACPVKYMYMPIAYNMEEVRQVLACPDINTVGVEAIAKTPEDELFQEENVRWMRDQGLFVWVNAITLGGLKQHILYGGLDDDLALLEGPEKSWGRIMDKGVNVIQTDWPVQLSQYRREKLNRV